MEKLPPLSQLMVNIHSGYNPTQEQLRQILIRVNQELSKTSEYVASLESDMHNLKESIKDLKSQLVAHK